VYKGFFCEEGAFVHQQSMRDPLCSWQRRLREAWSAAGGVLHSSVIVGAAQVVAAVGADQPAAAAGEAMAAGGADLAVVIQGQRVTGGSGDWAGRGGAGRTTL
jgi:hypothetical protein